MGSVIGMHDRENVEVGWLFQRLMNFPISFNYYALKQICWQVFCYALSANDGSEWRLRIQSEVEHFIDVLSMSSDMIDRMINEDKIQILVNLNGYTKV